MTERYPWLCEMLKDPDVSDIWINGPTSIYAERAGQIVACSEPGVTVQALNDLAYTLAANANRPMSVRDPVLETTWTDHARVQAVIPPLAKDHAVFAFRKPRFSNVTLHDLVAQGMCSEPLAEFLRQSVKERRTIVVCGSTGSGKTTVMQALLREVNDVERVIVLEDTAELELPEHLQGVNLLSKPSRDDEPAIELADLVRVALRMRPDRIVIGEVRGREAFGMVQALNTGHAGGITSLHANSCLDALLRLETLLMLTEGLTPSFSRKLLQRAMDIFVFVERLPTGIRRIADVTVLPNVKDSRYSLQSWNEPN